MKIIDAHLHFRPGEREYFNQIAIAAGHENTEAHLRQEYARRKAERAGGKMINAFRFFIILMVLLVVFFYLVAYKMEDILDWFY